MQICVFLSGQGSSAIKLKIVYLYKCSAQTGCTKRSLPEFVVQAEVCISILLDARDRRQEQGRDQAAHAMWYVEAGCNRAGKLGAERSATYD